MLLSDVTFGGKGVASTNICIFVVFLKELIQNAEDAGATEVKFMYDETEHGVESLWSPDMEQHQGEKLGNRRFLAQTGVRRSVFSGQY